MSGTHPAPLSGVRVVNLGLHIAGPLAALLLEGAGAEIVHIVPPQDRLPPERLPALIRGKHCMRLDLKSGAGRGRFHDLLAQSDILIEGFRPGVMTRLGLALDELRARYPRLITCSIPGFASDDPRVDLPGWEGAVLAAAGALVPVIADAKASLDGEQPDFPATPIASNFAALIASIGIVAALIERGRSGSGQGIEISLFDAMFEAIGDVGTWIDNAGPDRNPRDRFGGGTYPCADGRWVQFNTQNPDFLFRLYERAGLEKRDGGRLPDVERLAWDASYRAALKKCLAVEFARRPAEWWEALGLDAGVALIACRTLSEWRQSPHARAAEIVSPQGEAVPPCPGVRFLQGRPVEGRNTHSSQIDVGSPRPLGHIRVVDVSHYLAGPSAARLLAQLGADVSKLIEPSLRNLHKHDYVNRGKKTILCDLGHADGQKMLRGLLRRSDVFVHNFLPSSLQKLKLEREDIRRINPDIVYASVSAYGENGAFSGRPGYETQGQAVSGMMLLKNPSRPTLHPFPVNDYGTGLATAFGIVCSLYSVADRGVVHDVESSLARTATLFQACIPPAGAVSTENRGHDWSAPADYLQIAVRARGQWICVCGPGSEICELLGLEAAGGGEGWPLDRIAERIARHDLPHWTVQFSGTDVNAVPVAELADVMRDPGLRLRGLVSDIGNSELGTLTVPEPGLRFSRSAVWRGAPHARPGAHADEVRALLHQDAGQDAASSKN